jgi:hypothetical protein
MRRPSGFLSIRKGYWTFAALPLLLVPLFAVFVLDGGEAPTSWEIPAWSSGDAVAWQVSVFDPEGTKKGPIRDWVLRGPYMRHDGGGIPREAHYWESQDPRGFDWPSLDLARGYSFELIWGGASGVLGTTMIDYSPGLVFSKGLDLQGLTLGADQKIVVPTGFRGGNTTWTVTSITNDRLVVEGIRTHEVRFPVYQLRAIEPNPTVRYVLEYERGSPYPALASVYNPHSEQGWELAIQTELVRFDLAPGERVARAPPPPFDEVVRPAKRAVPQAAASFIDGELHPRFPATAILDEVVADEGLRSYLTRHPNAALIDVASFRASTPGGTHETLVWNLTWADPGSGAWYSLVRARTFDAALTLDRLLEPLVPAEVQDRFADWRSGPFHLEIPWLIPPVSEPQVTIAAALERLREDAGRTPAGFRWSPIVFYKDHTQPVLDSRPNYIAKAPMWGLAAGAITYSEGRETFGTDLADLWFFADTGYTFRTQFGPPHPTP